MPAKPYAAFGPSGESNSPPPLAVPTALLPQRGVGGQNSSGSVAFPTAFAATPGVATNVLDTSGTTANFVVLSAISLTGFSWIMRAYSGGTTSGTISYIASGS